MYVTRLCFSTNTKRSRRNWDIFHLSDRDHVLSSHFPKVVNIFSAFLVNADYAFSRLQQKIETDNQLVNTWKNLAKNTHTCQT